MDDTLKTNIPDRASPSEESTIRLFPILGGSRRLDISSEIIHRAFMLMLKRFEDAKDAYDAPNPLMDEPHVLLLLPPPPSFSFLHPPPFLTTINITKHPLLLTFHPTSNSFQETRNDPPSYPKTFQTNGSFYSSETTLQRILKES